MPVKLLGDGTARFYYKNEDGTYTEKELKRWINRIGRLIRRRKRLKEQERRSMLKWRALHHD